MVPTIASSTAISMAIVVRCQHIASAVGKIVASGIRFQLRRSFVSSCSSSYDTHSSSPIATTNSHIEKSALRYGAHCPTPLRRGRLEHCPPPIPAAKPTSVVLETATLNHGFSGFLTCTISAVVGKSLCVRLKAPPILPVPSTRRSFLKQLLWAILAPRHLLSHQLLQACMDP